MGSSPHPDKKEDPRIDGLKSPTWILTEVAKLLLIMREGSESSGGSGSVHYSYVIEKLERILHGTGIILHEVMKRPLTKIQNDIYDAYVARNKEREVAISIIDKLITLLREPGILPKFNPDKDRPEGTEKPASKSVEEFSKLEDRLTEAITNAAGEGNKEK
jgi:hypothetical protein